MTFVDTCTRTSSNVGLTFSVLPVFLGVRGLYTLETNLTTNDEDLYRHVSPSSGNNNVMSDNNIPGVRTGFTKGPLYFPVVRKMR